MMTGGCHCGAVRYQVAGEPRFHAICHCHDCRRSAGAPMVAWIAFPAANVTMTSGTPKMRASSEHGRRHFCAVCGTGLFYTNEVVMPGVIDVQTATLDDANAVTPDSHIQYAEHLRWVEALDGLQRHNRYPPP